MIHGINNSCHEHWKLSASFYFLYSFVFLQVFYLMSIFLLRGPFRVKNIIIFSHLIKMSIIYFGILSIMAVTQVFFSFRFWLFCHVTQKSMLCNWSKIFPLISITHLRVLLVVLYLVQEMIWIINSWKPKYYMLAGKKPD